MRLGAVVLCLSAASVGCADEPGPPPSEFRTTAAIEEVMRYIIDPAADAVWDAVVIEVGAQGTTETVPTTDEDWAALRRHAMTLLEGRRVAVPGSRSEMPGVDLEPEEIEALLAADRPAWNQFVGALHASGLVVLDAVDRRDVDALLVAGDQLDLTCENCHLRYWYPGLVSPDSTPN
jgi:hypothetical protein